MQLRNHSPFAPFFFKSRDKFDRVHDVVVVKGTYDIVDLRRLKISQEQEPVTTADEYYGDPHTTSLRRHGDLAAFKPRADVFVVGSAHAPGHTLTQSWLTEVRVGDTRKILRVFGPRTWRRGLARWTLSEPEPCFEVPIRYELAYGGSFGSGPEGAIFDQNPIGLGFVKGSVPSEVRELPAPRIEDARHPIEAFAHDVAPAGFGPIGRHWQPRIARAGTFDERWKKTRWPLMPHDWDDTFYNAAHPDLIHPTYLRGGEPFSALAMTPHGAPHFAVPREQIEVRFRYHSGAIVEHPTNLDTLLVDLTIMKVMLVFRARVPEVGSIRVIEILMSEVGDG